MRFLVNSAPFHLPFFVFSCGIYSFSSLLITVLLTVISFLLLDRLIIAAVQRRSGPYNVGWFGLLQPINDGIKLMRKQFILPQHSKGIMFIVLLVIFFAVSLILFTILPFSQNSAFIDFILVFPCTVPSLPLRFSITFEHHFLKRLKNYTLNYQLMERLLKKRQLKAR